MYDDILVPTDGSAGSQAAVERAIDLAKTYDAAIHTLYVVDTSGVYESEAPQILSALEEAGQDAVDEVIEQAEEAGVDTVEGSIASGVPHRAILDYTDEHNIDLVVMGTHGRTGLDRYLLGSVTEKVLRLADVPVMTVKIGESEESD